MKTKKSTKLMILQVLVMAGACTVAWLLLMAFDAFVINLSAIALALIGPVVGAIATLAAIAIGGEKSLNSRLLDAFYEEHR